MRSNWKTLLAICCGIVMLAYARPADSPRLVILISMDQMRADYFDRFANEFAGGLKRISHEGLVYANASLNYAGTETGPGHATLATGSYPRTHGILGNDWPDRHTRQQIYCVSDTAAKPLAGEGGKVSPRNLSVSAFGDWLKVASPRSKVISMAVKDRAAVLMGGQRPNGVFWYTSESGHMVTSDYYVETLPDWVKQFNASNWVGTHVPAAWTKLKEDSVYAKLGPDEMAGEFVWGETKTFPHVFLPERKNSQMLTSPWGDMLILDFATAAIRTEKLGQRGQTDFLAVGLSCTDYVGHSFGPDSHEMLDHLLRVDRALGEFLKFVDQTLGKGEYVVALSADHGVMPLPEYLIQIKKERARRIFSDRELKPQIESMLATLQQEIGAEEALVQQNAFLNYAAAAKHGIDSLTLENKIREGALQIEGVADVYFRRELLNDTTPDRPYLGHFRRSYFAPRGRDVLLRYCENCLITSRPTGTTHGSAYRYDAHVPVIFFGQSIPAGRVQREVHTVDVTPTLAKLLDIPYPATVEGVPLEEIVR